jgi:hypothetical protein
MLLGKDNVADHVTYVALLGGDFKQGTYVFRAQAGNRNSHGIRGEGTGTGFGVYGVSTAAGTGIRGYSASAQGVHGITDGQSITSLRRPPAPRESLTASGLWWSGRG